MGSIKIAETDMSFLEMCEYEVGGYCALLKEFGTLSSLDGVGICNSRYKEILEAYKEAFSRLQMAKQAIYELYPEIPRDVFVTFDFSNNTAHWEG